MALIACVKPVQELERMASRVEQDIVAFDALTPMADLLRIHCAAGSFPEWWAVRRSEGVEQQGDMCAEVMEDGLTSACSGADDCGAERPWFSQVLFDGMQELTGCSSGAEGGGLGWGSTERADVSVLLVWDESVNQGVGEAGREEICWDDQIAAALNTCQVGVDGAASLTVAIVSGVQAANKAGGTREYLEAPLSQIATVFRARADEHLLGKSTHFGSPPHHLRTASSSFPFATIEEAQQPIQQSCARGLGPIVQQRLYAIPVAVAICAGREHDVTALPAGGVAGGHPGRRIEQPPPLLRCGEVLYLHVRQRLRHGPPNRLRRRGPIPVDEALSPPGTGGFGTAVVAEISHWTLSCYLPALLLEGFSHRAGILQLQCGSKNGRRSLGRIGGRASLHEINKKGFLFFIFQYGAALITLMRPSDLLTNSHSRSVLRST